MIRAYRNLKRQCAECPGAPQPHLAGLIGAVTVIVLLSVVGAAWSVVLP